jgi:hypothetical protein
VLDGAMSFKCPMCRSISTKLVAFDNSRTCFKTSAVDTDHYQTLVNDYNMQKTRHLLDAVPAETLLESDPDYPFSAEKLAPFGIDLDALSIPLPRHDKLRQWISTARTSFDFINDDYDYNDRDYDDPSDSPADIRRVPYHRGMAALIEDDRNL